MACMVVCYYLTVFLYSHLHHLPPANNTIEQPWSTEILTSCCVERGWPRMRLVKLDTWGHRLGVSVDLGTHTSWMWGVENEWNSEREAMHRGNVIHYRVLRSGTKHSVAQSNSLMWGPEANGESEETEFKCAQHVHVFSYDTAVGT
ncbi:hypothetical protein BDR04DRAFT_1140766 [Suillus decipiens]|nr:hypothetical protein BDR04DRAFT_1140766 [Suillus decipiens]